MFVLHFINNEYLNTLWSKWIYSVPCIFLPGVFSRFKWVIHPTKFSGLSTWQIARTIFFFQFTTKLQRNFHMIFSSQNVRITWGCFIFVHKLKNLSQSLISQLSRVYVRKMFYLFESSFSARCGRINYTSGIARERATVQESPSLCQRFDRPESMQIF